MSSALAETSRFEGVQGELGKPAADLSSAAESVRRRSSLCVHARNRAQITEGPSVVPERNLGRARAYRARCAGCVPGACARASRGFPKTLVVEPVGTAMDSRIKSQGCARVTVPPPVSVDIHIRTRAAAGSSSNGCNLGPMRLETRD